MYLGPVTPIRKLMSSPIELQVSIATTPTGSTRYFPPSSKIVTLALRDFHLDCGPGLRRWSATQGVDVGCSRYTLPALSYRISPRALLSFSAL